MTQDEIFDALEDEREKLLEAIDGLDDERLNEPGVAGDWSVKDMLYHLSMWEAELVKLLWQAAQGDAPTTIHFGKIDVDQVNARWYAQGKERLLQQVLDDLQAVRKQTTRRLERFRDADLNNPQRYPWLKNHPLWVWIAEDSFKHEAEHTAQILAWRSEKGY
jgi:uncharacterized damage-inducible protein DinB